MSFETKAIQAGDKVEFYAELVLQARGLLHGERDHIANAANFAALVWHALPSINWCGFYFFDGTELVVGPFQGKPACVRIALGRGVCGTAATTRETQLVDDVFAFPGHIACDAASRSEIVVPLVSGGDLIGVWDVDSPEPARFDGDDRAGMQTLCQVYIESMMAVPAREKSAA
jgi:GAF domain-containing protein